MKISSEANDSNPQNLGLMMSINKYKHIYKRSENIKMELQKCSQMRTDICSQLLSLTQVHPRLGAFPMQLSKVSAVIIKLPGFL